jgi:ribose 5-phosphate isomerase B
VVLRANTVEHEESAINAGKFSMTDQAYVQAGDTVAIASDHAGFSLKETLREDLEGMGFTVLNLGTNDETSVDYPDFGRALADAVSDGRAKAGVAVCGTGIGISIAANRVPSVRAALVHNEMTAEMAREHNDANVMAIGARVVDLDTARACLRTFFTTPFAGGRHERRVAKLSAA